MARNEKKSKQSHACPLCDKRVKGKHYLELHLRRHTGEEPFKCNNCEKDFCTNIQLQNHSVIHSNAKPHKCGHPGCNRTFKRKTELTRHRWVHEKNNSNSCIFCKHPFRDKARLFTHLLSHIREKPHICGVCGTEKISRNNVKEHYLWCHTDQRPFKCSSCDKTYNSSTSLMRHKRTIHFLVPRRKEMNLCRICGETFESYLSLVKHRALHSGSQFPHGCFLCDKGFYTPEDLNVHIRSHTGERPYKCGKCSKSYTCNSNLTRHLKTHDTNRKKYSCPKCAKRFLSFRGLKLHQERFHGGKKLEECVFCQTKFFSAEELFSHLRTHILEKPFICKFCRFESRSNQVAIEHYLSCHAKERPYKCQLCDKSFTSSKNLWGHRKASHQGKGKIVAPNASVKNHLLFD